MSQVLEFWGGFDPSANAGIGVQAEVAKHFDLEVAAFPTCLTAQSRQSFARTHPVAEDVLDAMVRTARAPASDDEEGKEYGATVLCAGLIPSASSLDILVRAVKERPVPWLVVDPLVAPSTGTPESFYGADWQRLLHAQMTRLYPLAQVLTPNRQELTELERQSVDLGMEYADLNVLVTDGENGEVVWQSGMDSRSVCRETWSFPREVASFRGSGCTFNAALASGLALGWSLPQAVDIAIEYCARCITASPVGSAGFERLRRVPAGDLRTPFPNG